MLRLAALAQDDNLRMMLNRVAMYLSSAASLLCLPRGSRRRRAGEVGGSGGAKQHRGNIVFRGAFRAGVAADADALLTAPDPEPAVLLTQSRALLVDED